jgi:2-keto-4-pentenoate hydratase/2-oxohepta-3-ene-1,7-dioic acid hydratase in catechol pathway
MRLVTYGSEWSTRSGIEVDGRVVDTEAVARHAGLCSDGDGRWRSNRHVLAAGERALAALAEASVQVAADPPTPGAVRALDQVVLGPPIPDPDKIVCLGLNYRDHAEETGLTPPPAPMLFAKYRNSLAGPTAPIVLPSGVDAIDYEVELAVVIGRTAKDVTEDEALACVAGAMALNDVSARGLQLQTSQWMAGKAIDTFAPCGPALVTCDELGDLQALSLATRVNGETVQDGNTANMIFSIAETIAFISRLMTLVPGDVIATGTPAGVGHSRKPPLLVRAGDTLEVEVEGVGTLRNPVVAATDGPVPVETAAAATS